jgi:hypothetical protein
LKENLALKARLEYSSEVGRPSKMTSDIAGALDLIDKIQG